VSSTLGLSMLLDSKLTNKLKIETDAVLVGKSSSKENILQLGFGEVTDKKVNDK
jgi:hypothetical protein